MIIKNTNNVKTLKMVSQNLATYGHIDNCITMDIYMYVYVASFNINVT